jgi:hypothetical protein
MMRFRAEQRSDGSWVIYDTHKGEICFATRSIDQMLAERWADETFDAAYAAFRDEAKSFPSAGRTSDTPQGDGRNRLPGVEATIGKLLPVSESETTGPAPSMPSAA